MCASLYFRGNHGKQPRTVLFFCKKIKPTGPKWVQFCLSTRKYMCAALFYLGKNLCEMISDYYEKYP